MTIELQTKKEVTKKFVIGIIIIIVSFIIGKVVFLPMIFFPGDSRWKLGMLIIYITSWLMLLFGILLTGVEGYRLATRKYRLIQHRTVLHVKRGSIRAAGAMASTGKHAARHTARVTKTAARYTAAGAKIAARHTAKVVKSGADRFKPKKKI
jgi:hypothetical protein